MFWPQNTAQQRKKEKTEWGWYDEMKTVVALNEDQQWDFILWETSSKVERWTTTWKRGR